MDIILRYIVRQAILPGTLFLFFPIYIMCEKTMKGKGMFSITQAKCHVTTLGPEGTCGPQYACWTESNSCMRWLKMGEKVPLGKNMQKNVVAF